LQARRSRVARTARGPPGLPTDDRRCFSSGRRERQDRSLAHAPPCDAPTTPSGLSPFLTIARRRLTCRPMRIAKLVLIGIVAAVLGAACSSSSTTAATTTKAGGGGSATTSGGGGGGGSTAA